MDRDIHGKRDIVLDLSIIRFNCNLGSAVLLDKYFTLVARDPGNTHDRAVVCCPVQIRMCRVPGRQIRFKDQPVTNFESRARRLVDCKSSAGVISLDCQFGQRHIRGRNFHSTAGIDTVGAHGRNHGRAALSGTNYLYSVAVLHQTRDVFIRGVPLERFVGRV